MSFILDDAHAMMWGGELLLRDGIGAGQVTSAAFGTTIGSCVGLAYVWRPDGAVVTPDWINEGTWQVNIGGTVVSMRVQLGAPYDPRSERVRS